MKTGPTPHLLSVQPLSRAAFAPYGEIIEPRRAGGQGVQPSHGGAEDPGEAKLVLHQGVPRLWLMQLPNVGLSFSRIARHRRVTQCLGALDGSEWLIAVAPPNPAAAAPALADIVAFRVGGARILKLHEATWHAGPHFVQRECTFFNLENLDTNERDFEAAELGVLCQYAVASA